MTATPVLEMRHIAKAFGKFYALKGVDLTVWPGEIHALMGRTAPEKHADEDPRRRLYRHQRRDPDRRKIANDPRPQGRAGRRDHIDLPEMQLAPNLTVAENIFLGSELARGGLVQRKAMLSRAGGDRPSRGPVQSQRPGDDPDHRRTAAGGDRPRPAPSKPHSGDG